jgi:hypothetical protein
MAAMTKSDHHGTYEVAVTVDFASVATVTAAEQNMTVAGVDPTIDTCLAVVPDAATIEAGVGFGGCRVSAANTVAVKLVNPTAAGVDPASRVYRVVLARK